MVKAKLVLSAGTLHSTTFSCRPNVSCRAPIDISQLQRFTVQEDQPQPKRPLISKGELVPVSHREIQYNMIGESRLLKRFEQTIINYRERSQFVRRHSDDGIEWKLRKQDSDTRSTFVTHPTRRSWRQEYRFFCMG